MKLTSIPFNPIKYSSSKTNNSNVGFSSIKTDNFNKLFENFERTVILPILGRKEKEKLIFEAVTEDADLRLQLYESFINHNAGKTFKQALKLLDNYILQLPDEIKNKKDFYEVVSYDGIKRIFPDVKTAQEFKTEGDSLRKISLETQKLIFIPYDDLMEFKKDIIKLVASTLPIKGTDEFKHFITGVFLYKKIAHEILLKSGYTGIFTDNIRHMKGNPFFTNIENFDQVVVCNNSIISTVV